MEEKSKDEPKKSEEIADAKQEKDVNKEENEDKKEEKKDAPTEDSKQKEPAIKPVLNGW